MSTLNTNTPEKRKLQTDENTTSSKIEKVDSFSLDTTKKFREMILQKLNLQKSLTENEREIRKLKKDFIHYQNDKIRELLNLELNLQEESLKNKQIEIGFIQKSINESIEFMEKENTINQ